MSKYYKYIVIVYLLICIVLIGISLIPKNPFKYSGDIVELSDEANILKENDEYAIFSNYELNYISLNNLDKGYQVGRNMNYYNHNENYEYFDAEYFMRIEMDDDIMINTYYFYDSKYILCKVEMDFDDFINYQNYLKIRFEHNILDWSISYEYKNKEYSITKFQKVNNQNTYLLNNSLSIKISTYKPKVTGSVFLSVDNINSNEGFYVELLRRVISDRRSLSIGLNTIKEDANRTYVEYVGSFLEIRG